MTTGKRRARLLIQGLSDTDAEQVQAVVTTLRHQTFNDWHVVVEGDGDFVLIGPGEPTTLFGMVDKPLQILQVGGLGADRTDRDGALTSPLRYVALAVVLTDVDRRLAARRAAELGSLTQRLCEEFGLKPP